MNAGPAATPVRFGVLVMPRKKKADLPPGNITAPTKENKTPFMTIEDVLLRKNSPIEQKRIAHEVMALVGGERGLAQKIMEEYNGTLPGSPARARFFDVLLKLVAMAAPKELSGDLDYVTEDDLSRILREHVADAGVKIGYPTHVCI